MSTINRRLFRGILLLWASCAALIHPGVPSCWLKAQACASHVHYGRVHAETPHTHDYLSELAQMQLTQSLAPQLIPVGLLLALLFYTQILRPTAGLYLLQSSWHIPPDPPPPRFSLSS